MLAGFCVFCRISSDSSALSSDTYSYTARSVDRHTGDQTVNPLFTRFRYPRSLVHHLIDHSNGSTPHATCVAPWIRSTRGPEGNTRSRHLRWIIADIGYSLGTVPSSSRSSPETAGRSGETIVIGTVSDIVLFWRTILIQKIGVSISCPCQLHMSSRSTVWCRLLR